MLAKINNIPYFLWLSTYIDIEIDQKKKTAKLLDGETSITPVKDWIIILIKHIPILLIAFFFMADLDLIYNIKNSFVLVMTLSFVTGGFFLFAKYKMLFLPFVFLGSISIFYGVNLGYAEDMDYSFAISMQLGVIILVLYDIYRLGNGYTYYYLDNSSKEIILHNRKKQVSFSLGGIFIRVYNEK